MTVTTPDATIRDEGFVGALPPPPTIEDTEVKLSQAALEAHEVRQRCLQAEHLAAQQVARVVGEATREQAVAREREAELSNQSAALSARLAAEHAHNLNLAATADQQQHRAAELEAALRDS